VGERGEALQAHLMAGALPYRVEIDRDACMGSGVCTVLAPDTFDIDHEAKAFVADVAGNCLDQIESAASGCPTHAITVVPVTEDLPGQQGHAY
jgi:ferredoxin